ncbi:hypothetical protein [Lysinibacillus sp. NPDC056232]|uniref:hypothetical protein n=1 Tax=Lysinibacillus sp. NPDC056232 TaxID=3345756 RepID=UPI0035DA05FC
MRKAKRQRQMFYLCAKAKRQQQMFYLCAKAKRQQQMFYLCESEASATNVLSVRK